MKLESREHFHELFISQISVAIHGTLEEQIVGNVVSIEFVDFSNVGLKNLLPIFIFACIVVSFVVGLLKNKLL